MIKKKAFQRNVYQYEQRFWNYRVHNKRRKVDNKGKDLQTIY